jgi:hypothetical protein
MNQLESNSAPRTCQLPKQRSKHATPSYQSYTLRLTRTKRYESPNTPKSTIAQDGTMILIPTMAVSLVVFSNLPIQPLSPLPYLTLRLHIRSLGYQQLSSGCLSPLTCRYQRRRVELTQTQCEGEVEQLGLDKVGNTPQDCKTDQTWQGGSTGEWDANTPAQRHAQQPSSL